MRSHNILPATLLALCACAACGSSQQPTSNAANSSASSSEATQNRAQTVVVPPVASAHGSGGGSVAPSPQAGATSAEKPSIPTPELDAKIAKAEAKAKATKASDADKRTAASAYVERANVYYTAQQPMLYKFALGDFRRALRYDPNNTEARTKMDQIVSIYQSMGKPVPTNGLDQQ
jgi:tetratricopeptide (TPR) repeat protein